MAAVILVFVLGIADSPGSITVHISAKADTSNTASAAAGNSISATIRTGTDHHCGN